MKTTAIAFVATVLFSACFGSDDQTPTQDESSQSSTVDKTKETVMAPSPKPGVVPVMGKASSTLSPAAAAAAPADAKAQCEAIILKASMTRDNATQQVLVANFMEILPQVLPLSERPVLVKKLQTALPGWNLTY